MLKIPGIAYPHVSVMSLEAASMAVDVDYRYFYILIILFAT